MGGPAKSCPTCGGAGPFSKDRTRSDGLSREYKSCAKARAKAWREAHPKRAKGACKAWREANPERVRDANRTWYEKHRTEAITASVLWAKDNSERRRATARRIEAEKRAFIRTLKKGRPCRDCGGQYPNHCMDFDHVRGNKQGIISWMVGRSKKAILAEVTKCELVCANCHRIRTERRKSLKNERRSRRVFKDRMRCIKANPCTDCESTFSPPAMEFDHVRGEKLSCISEMREALWEDVVKELAKCDLVCAVCHRKRTEVRRVFKVA